jgi:hypothetical protein
MVRVLGLAFAAEGAEEDCDVAQAETPATRRADAPSAAR